MMKQMGGGSATSTPPTPTYTAQPARPSPVSSSSQSIGGSPMNTPPCGPGGKSGSGAPLAALQAARQVQEEVARQHAQTMPPVPIAPPNPGQPQAVHPPAPLHLMQPGNSQPPLVGVGTPYRNTQPQMSPSPRPTPAQSVNSPIRHPGLPGMDQLTRYPGMPSTRPVNNVMPPQPMTMIQQPPQQPQQPQVQVSVLTEEKRKKLRKIRSKAKRNGEGFSIKFTQLMSHRSEFGSIRTITRGGIFETTSSHRKKGCPCVNCTTKMLPTPDSTG